MLFNGLRYSIYMQFLKRSSLYHKDSFVTPEDFDSSFLDLELVYKTTVVTDRSHTKTYIPKSLPEMYISFYSEFHLPEYFLPYSHWINTHVHFEVVAIRLIYYI